MANNGSNGKKSGAQLNREIDEVLHMRQKKQAAAAPPSRSGAPSQSEYERRELADAHRKLDDLRRAPLAERKEAQAEFLEAMRDHPEIVGERVGWLLNGNYGYGSMQLAKRVLASPRMNRSAALTQMIAAYEWQSPEDMARAAWKKLTKGQQSALERAVQTAIKRAESEE
jgi:hypothetical protein